MIGWWPFVDAAAFFIVLMEAPSEIMAAACAGFLYWKRTTLCLPAQFAAAVVTAVALYSRIGVWHFVYTFAASILASSAAESHSWFPNSAYLTAGTAALRLALRLPPRASAAHLKHNRMYSAVLKGMLVQVIFTAATHLLVQITRDAQDDALPKRGRRLAAMRARQPFWTFLAVQFCRMRNEDDLPSPQIVVRYVKERSVGIEAPRSSGAVKVDGIAWPQVHREGDLLLIYGLVPAKQYRVEIGGIEAFVSTEVQGDGSAKRSQPGSREETASAAEDLLNDEKLRLRKLKKDHSKRLATLRQEIAAVADRQERSAKSDERIRRKVLSLQDQVRQLQDEIKELETSERELSERRPEATAAYAVREREWNEKRIEHDRVQKQLHDLSAAKATELRGLHAKIAELEAWITTLKKKSEDLTTEVSGISQATEEAVRAVIDSRAENRKAKQLRRLRQEQEFVASIDKLERGVAEMQHRAALVTQAAGTWSNDWS